MVHSEKDDLGHAVGFGSSHSICPAALHLQSFRPFSLFLYWALAWAPLYPRSGVFCSQVNFPQLEEEMMTNFEF
ncbi:TPA: hypothetical protein ACGOVU_001141 [Streptococcus suis]